MESTEELQQLEITALRSIYGEDFIDCPPPKAWKGATRLPEFIIRIAHPDPEYASKMYILLNVKFPKTYPHLACATFAVQKDGAKGLTPEQINKLTHAINAEAQKFRGQEMVMELIDFAQTFLTTLRPPPLEPPGSLALQMSQRAQDAERARLSQEAEALARAEEEESRRREELESQIYEEQERQNRIRGRAGGRARAGSEATEVGWPGRDGGEYEGGYAAGYAGGGGGYGEEGEGEGEETTVMVEYFPGKEVVVGGMRFGGVKLFCPRSEPLGTVYLAEPIYTDTAESERPVLPANLELFVVRFESSYYSTSQGRKKLKQLETEIQRLITVRHPNLLSVFAVKLVLPGGPPHSASGYGGTLSAATSIYDGMHSASSSSFSDANAVPPHSADFRRTGAIPAQLMVLTEQFPALTLHDVLEDCDLREDRASNYLAQILSALNTVHAAELVHRGITTRCIGLTSQQQQQQQQQQQPNLQPALSPGGASSSSKQIKLGRVGYYTRLLDLHRSNPFGGDVSPSLGGIGEETDVPEGWLSRDVKNESSLLYTRQRDIHAVGIVLLQMLLGLNVTERYSDVHAAVQSAPISLTLARAAINMILPPKKNHTTCLTLLADLAEASFHTTTSQRSASMPYSNSGPKTPVPVAFGSPEVDYFKMPARRQASRWKEDWEELELLGKGAFGSVVKARNKIDNRIYAVKKVRLKTMQSDTKIFREVNALSRLSHRFIVRYYTTWVETSEPRSTAVSDDSSASGTEDSMTSVPDDSSERHLPTNGNGFGLDLHEFDDVSASRSSFPSIHFGSSEPGSSEEESSGDDADAGFGSLFKEESRSGGSGQLLTARMAPTVSRTLYIQMEFVERQTLRERVDEGISEDEAWRLFQQIVDALVHMSTLGILHRDIKLTNIFIDGKGDCKVGDFGLATSSLAAVDPSDVSPHAVALDADMTLEVGTRLYIAPEVQSRKRGPRNHSKADMYSLGIVFFEMNYLFSTGAERIAVIEDLRKPGIFFPLGWDSHRSRQREIITWLLQHEPNDRPTALELSQSPLLPPRLEDEYFKGALRMMAKSDSPYHQAVLSSLFNQPPRPSRGFLYDLEVDPPEHVALNDTVHERLAALFRLHGAVDMEPPALMPVIEPEDEKNQATFIDRHGDIVALPNNILVPFARLAARINIRRIKRYHITNVYRPNPVAGHPKVQKAAVFDIITQDLQSGPIAAGAEIIAVANNCLNSFPNLAQNYDIHISHTKIVELALNRVPEAHRSAVIDILIQSKSSPSQKRALLLKKGLLRGTIDELEILSETDEDIDNVFTRLEKVAPTLVTLMQLAIEEVKSTVQFAALAGVTRTIFFHPLMLGSHHVHFKDGVIIEVVRKNKRMDVLAAGGRYDNLISRYAPLKQKTDALCAMSIQIAVEKITVALASFQSNSVKTLVKEERSFGFWSPRRCDVYVVSYQPGHLQDRLEVVSYLWQHNISADIMYESGLPDAEHESHLDTCAREGILFTVYPRPRAGRRDHPAFKVKSILKRTEYELTRQELVGFLQQQIAEQKRIDLTTSGAPVLTDPASTSLPIKDVPVSSDVQLVLPVDVKKQRKQVKSLFTDRAFEKGVQLKASFQSGMATLAIDVPQAVFEAMTRSTAWLSDEDAWKSLIALFPAQHSAYAHQVREAAVKRKQEGHAYVLLYSVKEERVQLLTLGSS